MRKSTARRLRIATITLAALVVLFPAFWGVFALWDQFPGGRALKASSAALWAVFSLAMLVLLLQGRSAVGLVGFAAAFGALLVWWHGISPSNDGELQVDRARNPQEAVIGGAVD